MKPLFDLPGVNVALSAFLLNLVWELAQVPLYRGLPSEAHWAAIQRCGRATLGDAAIAVVAFWAVAAAARWRRWITAPASVQVMGFVGVALVMTTILEWLATHVERRWDYAPGMPLVPLLGIGLAPVLQWMVLPPLVVWFVRRQLTSGISLVQ